MFLNVGTTATLGCDVESSLTSSLVGGGLIPHFPWKERLQTAYFSSARHCKDLAEACTLEEYHVQVSGCPNSVRHSFSLFLPLRCTVFWEPVDSFSHTVTLTFNVSLPNTRVDAWHVQKKNNRPDNPKKLGDRGNTQQCASNDVSNSDERNQPSTHPH